MEKRLELEKRGKNPADIVELNLDNSKSATIVGLTDEFVNLESLSLINVGLTSLKGFPKLPKLKRLELSDNRISNGLDNLTGSPNLVCLNLSGNKIRDFENLKPLSDFKHLESLDLFNCEVTHSEGYREKVFSMIPSLRYLDGFDAQDREKLSDDEDDYSENEEDEQSSDQEFDDEEEEEGESSGAVKADDDADDEEDDDDDDDDDEDDEEEESDEEEEDGAGLDQLAGSDIDEEPEGNDFEPGDDDDDDDEDIDDDLEEKKDDEARGQKRKLDESEADDE